MTPETPSSGRAASKLRRTLRRAAALLAVLVLVVGAIGFWRSGGAARAREQREAIGWDGFREEIENKIERAQRLATQASTFDAKAALEAAGTDRRNGFQYRFLDHLASAEPVPAGTEKDPSDTAEEVVSDPDPGGFGEWGIKATDVYYQFEARPAFEVSSVDGYRFAVELPDEPLELMFGLGSELRESPGTLKIRACFGERDESIALIENGPEAKWKTVRLELPPWAVGKGSIEWTFGGGGSLPAQIGAPVIFGRPVRRMNVVMIVEDTLRADHLSVYGYHRETSPFKRAFFEEGAVFEHAFSQGPKTWVSVASMMTSLYPSAAGVLSPYARVPAEALTLAEILKAQGYATAAVSQNPFVGRKTGLLQGFERFEEIRKGKKRPKSESIYGSQAIEQIDTFSGRNTFLYLHVLDPHGPYTPPKAFEEAGAKLAVGATADPLVFEGNPGEVDRGAAEGKRLAYGGEIRENDFHLEQFIRQLEERGLLEDTLILFLSDHGEYFGEHDLWGHKAPGFVQVTRVPLMMRHSKLIPAGVRFEEAVQLVDVVPTLLDLLEIPKEPFLISGDSLLPLIRNEEENRERWAGRLIVSQEDEELGGSFIRGAWHLLQTPVWLQSIEQEGKLPFYRRWWLRRTVSGEQVRVFNYQTDPTESDALMALSREERFRQDVSSLKAALFDEYAKVNASLHNEASVEMDVDPETVEALRDLGYL